MMYIGNRTVITLTADLAAAWTGAIIGYPLAIVIWSGELESPSEPWRSAVRLLP